MNKRRLVKLNGLVVFSLMLSLFLGGCQSGPTVEEIVAKMEEVEANTDDAHVVVAFSIESQGMDEEAVVEVWEKRPSKLRAEVLEASGAKYVGMVSVTDGQQAWMYNPSQSEVIVGSLSELDDGPTSPREAIRFMDEAIQQVLDTSEVELVGEEDIAGTATYKLVFTPRESEGDEAILPTGSQATLWVDQERWVVLQAHLTGNVFGEAWMRVRSFELNTGLTDDRFQFEIPEGVEVIQAEEMRAAPLTLDEAREKVNFTLRTPGYVPNGATLIEVFAIEGAIVLHYDHATPSFTVIQGISSEIARTPDGQTTEVTVRGQQGTLITDGSGNSFLTWVEEDGVNVTIAGHIDQDEVLKVAESLQ